MDAVHENGPFFNNSVTFRYPFLTPPLRYRFLFSVARGPRGELR